jgi:hypothetical protein
MLFVQDVKARQVESGIVPHFWIFIVTYLLIVVTKIILVSNMQVGASLGNCVYDFTNEFCHSLVYLLYVIV